MSKRFGWSDEWSCEEVERLLTKDYVRNETSCRYTLLEFGHF
jgi:hypothetical protein